jgi:hypothetical protein
MLGLAVNNATKHVNYGTFRIFPFQATPSERPPASRQEAQWLVPEIEREGYQLGRFYTELCRNLRRGNARRRAFQHIFPALKNLTQYLHIKRFADLNQDSSASTGPYRTRVALLL